MKTIAKLLTVFLLLMCTLFVNAQKIDSTTCKIKLAKFERKEHNGKIMTIGGGGAIVVGGVLTLVGYSQQTLQGATYTYTEYRNTTLGIVGAVLGAVGVVSTVMGLINWSTGKNKVKEYKMRLDDFRSGFYITPNNVGVKLTFKF
jgi:hypothetical protein